MKLIYSDHCLEHKVDENCPENAGRLTLVLENVPFIEEGIQNSKNGTAGMVSTDILSGDKYLSLVHEEGYINQVKDKCLSLGVDEIYNQGDISLSRESYQAACFAVGAAVGAAELAKRGTKSFALTRPPGHHAHPNEGKGFCIFNNVAIASEYLRQQGEKVMIVDVDLHLGDGTLAHVEGRKDMFYFSINHEGIYPHQQPGDSANTRNIFLPKETNDATYISVLERELPLAIKQFNPDIVAVSAGFDTMGMDYLDFGQTFGGGFLLTHASYKALWNLLDRELKPYFIVLEGGYNPMSVLGGVLSFFDKEKKEF